VLDMPAGRRAGGSGEHGVYVCWGLSWSLCVVEVEFELTLLLVSSKKKGQVSALSPSPSQ
jgi:hypothetical protein